MFECPSQSTGSFKVTGRNTSQPEPTGSHDVLAPSRPGQSAKEPSNQDQPTKQGLAGLVARRFSLRPSLATSPPNEPQPSSERPSNGRRLKKKRPAAPASPSSGWGPAVHSPFSPTTPLVPPQNRLFPVRSHDTSASCCRPSQDSEDASLEAYSRSSTPSGNKFRPSYTRSNSAPFGLPFFKPRSGKTSILGNKKNSHSPKSSGQQTPANRSSYSEDGDDEAAPVRSFQILSRPSRPVDSCSQPDHSVEAGPSTPLPARVAVSHGHQPCLDRQSSLPNLTSTPRCNIAPRRAHSYDRNSQSTALRQGKHVPLQLTSPPGANERLSDCESSCYSPDGHFTRLLPSTNPRHFTCSASIPRHALVYSDGTASTLYSRSTSVTALFSEASETDTTLDQFSSAPGIESDNDDRWHSCDDSSSNGALATSPSARDTSLPKPTMPGLQEESPVPSPGLDGKRSSAS